MSAPSREEVFEEVIALREQLDTIRRAYDADDDDALGDALASDSLDDESEDSDLDDDEDFEDADLDDDSDD